MKKTRRITLVLIWALALPSILILPMVASAQTTSPFTPPENRIGTVTVNAGPSLDTGCVYRSGGPLIVEIPIPSPFNHAEIDSDGTLKDPFKLIDSGVTKESILVRFPVFDVDSEANLDGIAPEVNRVTFNGEVIQNLRGINDTWTDGLFLKKIWDIRFQSSNSPDAVNELRIDIDTANVEEQWCMSLDWVSITFSAPAPYVLVHGIAAQSDSWDADQAPGVLAALDTSGVFYRRVSLLANGSPMDNAKRLNQEIISMLNPLFGDEINIIAHSKGGIDSQYLQFSAPKNYTILSLSTLSTPHLGSAAADLSMVQRQRANKLFNNGSDPNGYAVDYISNSGWADRFNQGPDIPGLIYLTTYTASFDIGVSIRGNIDPTFTFGADADLNANGMLEPNESSVLFPRVAHFGAVNAWQVLRSISAAPILQVDNVPGAFFGTNRIVSYQTILETTPQANDVVVTLKSANPSYGIPQGNSLANHSLVKSGANINKILELTLPLSVR